jgi:hypothetical protein
VHAAATTRIACQVERAFDLMADARNEPQWNSRVSNVELRSAEPIGAGSRFVIVNSGTEYDARISIFDRPSRLVFEATGNPDVTIAYSFTENGDATELASDLDFRPTGLSRILFFVLAPVIRRDVRKQYAAFKTLCER